MKKKKLPVVVVVCRGQLEALGARVLLHEAKELPCVLTAQLIRYSLTSQWSGAELETRKQRSSLFSICREKHSWEDGGGEAPTLLFTTLYSC
jgi:hypothetical protein